MPPRVLAFALFAVAACSSSEREFDDQSDAGTGAVSGSGGDGSGGDSGSAATGGGGSGATGGGTSGAGGSDGGTGGSDGGTGGSDGGTGGGEPPLAACAESRVDGLGQAVATATTTTDDGTFDLSCAVGRSDDVAFDWIAPARGWYAIGTEGSSFDTALAILPADCSETELACNDDVAGATHSEILRSFAAGEHVVLVVDGKNGGSGEVSLNVEAISCPSVDLSEQTLPVTLTTLDGTDSHEGACGGAARREKTLRWSAPSDGLYTVFVRSDDFAPALYIESGPRCGGQLLGCNAGAAGQSRTSVTRWLAAGEPITIIVDSSSGAGEFELDVQRVGDSCAAQAFDPINGTNPVMGTLIAGDPSVHTGSCAAPEVYVAPGGLHTLPEHAYAVTVAGHSFCTYEVTADAPVTLYVLDGNQCAGPELSCAASEVAGTDQLVEVTLGDATQTESRDYVLVVEIGDPFSADVNYTLFAFCAFV